MVLAELGGKIRSSLQKLVVGNNGNASLDALLGEISRALIESDVNVLLVAKLRNNVKERVGDVFTNSTNNNNKERAIRLVQKAVLDELTSLLSPSNAKPYRMRRSKPNVILFVGLQGAGKTTTVAKYASYYQRKGWKVAMVCADTFRAGAFDQLRQNATKLRVPFYGSKVEADPVKVAGEGVERFVEDGYEVILVDTSGRHGDEATLLDEMGEIRDAVKPNDVVFVMDATQGQAVHDQATAFRDAVSVGSVVVTKLDGHARGGGALSAVAATGSVVSFLGTGERFDDLNPFHARSFVNGLLGFGADAGGLAEEMRNVRDDGGRGDLAERLTKGGGKFTLRDMYKQFQNVMRIGPMNKVMGMVPGMPEYLIPKGGGDDPSNARLKKFMYMMDSMTDKELDGKVELGAGIVNGSSGTSGDKARASDEAESRIKRIARGSGTHPDEVKVLLKVHAQFEGMVTRMGKAGMIGGKNSGVSQARQRQAAEQMKKNPNALVQQLSRTNPQMLKQMGGREGLMNMMQQMGGAGGGMPGGGDGGGGMPDMATMAKMMGGMGGGGMGGSNGGGMPDMATMAKMMGGMGGGGGAGAGGMGGSNGGGMPDMATMAKMMGGMGMGGAGGGPR